MSSKITKVLIDYLREDPQAWDGLDFMKVTYPRRAGAAFIEYLADEADGLNMATEMKNDPVGLTSLLKDILKSENFSDDELTEIGYVIHELANEQ